MARNVRRVSMRVVAIAATAVVLGTATLTYLWWHSSIPAAPRSMRLADGVEIFFLTGSHALPCESYPHPREIRVDGDFFFRVPESAVPLIVRSRLLVLTITAKSALRVTAFAKEAGEQVEVLYGHVEAHKSYPSPYTEPDLLTDGQMTMVNRDIDLMEKETTDVGSLRAWSDALVESVASGGAPR